MSERMERIKIESTEKCILLHRKTGDGFLINNKYRVYIQNVSGGSVRVFIVVPKETLVDRVTIGTTYDN